MFKSKKNSALDFNFASIGSDVYIDEHVSIRYPDRVKIGNHVAIDFGFFVTTNCTIGDFIHIGPFVSSIGGLKGALVLEHLTSVAAGVRFICYGDEHLGDGIVGALIPKEFQDNRVGGEIKVSKYAAIGTNAVIMPGIKIGQGAVVGANSLLMQDAEPWTIYVGSPARPLRQRPRRTILDFGRRMGYE